MLYKPLLLSLTINSYFFSLYSALKHLILIALLGIVISGAKAQGPEIGAWRDHLPYDELIGVVQAGDLIYAASPYAIFTYNTTDNSIEKLIKGEEISDFGISRLAYSYEDKTVVVGYANGNLDLIKGTTTINMSAIKNSSISGDKEIYNIHCVDGLAYLATGFGIVVIDISREEVKDTYIIGAGGTQEIVYDVATDDTMIYAAMDDGIREADLSNNFLSDFSQWTLRSDLPQIGKSVTHLQEFNGDLFACFALSGADNDTVYALKGATWVLDTNESGQDTYGMRVDNNKLLVVHGYNTNVLNDVNNWHRNQWRYNGYSPLLRDAYFDGSVIWLGTAFDGLIRAIDNYNAQSILPIGPLYTENFSFAVMEEDLWVAGGSIFGGLGTNGFQQQGVYRFRGDWWKTFNKFSLPGSLFDSTRAYDFTYLTVNPSNPDNVFISSKSGMGLMELSGETVTSYNKNNSTITERTGQTDFYELAQPQFDEDGNLWVINSHSLTPVSVKDPSGNWHSLNCASLNSTTRLTRSALDEENHILWVAAVNTGVYAHFYNETPTDPTDDQCKILNSGLGTGNLPTQQVNCVTIDLDGELWIGTDQGPAVVYNPAEVFQGGDYDAQQILIEQDGNIQLLLETESITAITIDGANRKWIGTTTSGVYLISEDGTEQILHFTEANSPLPSNEIKDIAINGETGEVFFGTLNGIVSYKYNATEGQENYSSVYAYPNPVRPEYDGTIAIKGLLRDSDVKITDASGNLVYETTSFGGQATWDGRTYDGNRVTSGVYLVFASSSDGSTAVVTKIAIVN